MGLVGGQKDGIAGLHVDHVQEVYAEAAHVAAGVLGVEPELELLERGRGRDGLQPGHQRLELGLDLLIDGIRWGHKPVSRHQRTL